MNNNFETNNNNNKPLLLSIVGVLTLIVAIVGATYAYFQATATASGITGTVASSGLELTITSSLPSTPGNMIPQKAAAINAAANASCIDGIGNTVCRVFTLALKNKGNTKVVVTGKITFAGISTMPNLKWAKSTSQKSGYSTTGTAASTTAAEIESNIELAANGTRTIYIITWINETDAVQTDSGTFTASVTYNASNGKGVTSTITSA